MDIQTAKANIGQPFKYGSVYKWDTVRQVTDDGYIHGDFIEAPVEDCRLKMAQPEALKNYTRQKNQDPINLQK